MVFALSLLAAFGCAVCNAAATLLQKVAADKEATESSIRLGFLWTLARNRWYTLGIGLDIAAWILTFLAVQHLPLFLVESIIAASIGITAILEHIFLQMKLQRKTYLSMTIVLFGLILLATAATADRAEAVSNSVRWLLILLPLPIAAVAALLTRLRGRWAVTSISIMSGVAFGNTSVLSRIFGHYSGLGALLTNPLLYSLLVSGVLGMLLFSIALQRTRATVVNASMTSAQTLVPTIVGLTVLGDHIRNGHGATMVLGLAATVVGTLLISFLTPPTSHAKP